MWRLIFSLAIIQALLLESALTTLADDLQVPAQELFAHWKNVGTLEGHFVSKGTFGFSTDEDAQPAIVYAKVVKGKTVDSTTPSKLLAPYTTARWEENLNGKFLLETTDSYLKGGQLIDTEVDNVSWDGSTFSELEKSSQETSSMLKVDRHIPNRINAFASEPFLTNPFRFLIVTKHLSAITQGPDLQTLRDPATYLRLVKLAKPLGSQLVQGKECIVFDIDGGQNIFGENPIEYRVYLDPSEHFYPIGWDEINASTNCIGREYRVLELGKLAIDGGNVFRYPKRATVTYYNLTNPSAKKNPTTVYEEDIDSINVAPGDDSGFDFSIDPASADYILDVEKKAMIKVPR